MFPRFSPLQNLILASNSESSNFIEEGRVIREDDKLRFCRYCGGKIPYDSKFCPHCGASRERETPLSPTTFKRRSIRGFIEENMNRMRIITFLMSSLIFVSFFFMGSQTSLSSDEANLLIEEYIEAIGPSPTATQIALNNIFICLLLFIPFFGTFFLAFVSYNTGLMISALALYSGSITPIELFLTSFLFSWTWLEIAAYSLASAQSIMLLVGAFTRNLRKEAKNFLISLAICLVLLGLGAVIEAAYIV